MPLTHFVILFGMREKIAFYELPVSPIVAVLMQNQNEDIWNFHGSLTLNNGKLNYTVLMQNQNEGIWNFHGSVTLDNGKLI